MAISIRADLTAFKRLTRALKGTGKKHRRQTGRLLRNIGEDLVNSTQNRFENESAPDNSFWRGLSPATLRARKKGRSSISRPRTLRDSNRLFQSITYRLGRNALEIGSNAIYAAIHQFGGKAGRKHKVTIPARPFLGVSSSDHAKINRRVNDFLRRIAP